MSLFAWISFIWVVLGGVSLVTLLLFSDGEWPTADRSSPREKILDISGFFLVCYVPTSLVLLVLWIAFHG